MEDNIKFEKGNFIVPNTPTILFIEGDGIGKDITPVMQKVVDAAVAKSYNKQRKIQWKEILAGEKANKQSGSYLPDETLNAIKNYRIAIKGPLATPIGGGIRSLNVTIRQKLDLFACVRPVKYIPNVPSPLKNPDIDYVIFRENTEDVYAGLEWQQDSQECSKIIDFLNKNLNTKLKKSGIGIKPISETATKRLMKSAIKYAIKNNRKKITIMHKGNIMKFTEGAFRQWCYELAEQEFDNQTIKESDLKGDTDKIIINDRIADSMFQQILLRPTEYDMIIAPNLNGDYISDAAAAAVGGLGMAPGANINYETGIAVFEATHGTAPKYAGLDKVNPGSLILSAVMMLETMQWNEAAELIKKALQKTIQQKIVTYDLARQIEGAQEVSCSDFGSKIIDNLN